MKQLRRAYWLLLSFIAPLFSNAQQFTVHGSINTKDTLTVYIKGGLTIDSVISTDGSFYFTSRSSGTPRQIDARNKNGNMQFITKEFFVARGNVKVLPDGSVILSHPGLDRRYRKFTTYIDLLKAKLAASSNNISVKGNDKLQAEGKLVVAGRMKKYVEKFVFRNLNNPVGAFVFATYMQRDTDINKLESIYRKFKASLKHTPVLAHMKSMIDAKKHLAPGMPVAPFVASAITGQKVNLDSLHGKYVVLDFWGSWCPPCIADLPAINTTYNKYQGVCEFIGIAYRSDSAKIMALMQKYAITWPQVCNKQQSEDLAGKYGVSQFPTKILIDPKGNLVKVFQGEGQEFYTMLRKVMGGE